jgi:hypothetical protein
VVCGAVRNLSTGLPVEIATQAELVAQLTAQCRWSHIPRVMDASAPM